MSSFTIKRGMVFYLERPAESQPIRCISSFTPEKKRPYIVVSNDKCNEHSQLLNIAPIYTREANSDRWYQVPFKSTCNRDCVVDVGAIMLVPRELLNEASYSAAVTQYTIANSVLLDAIGRAIHRQFDVSEEIPERVVTPTVSAIPSQGITLNININGMSVTPKVSAEDNNITVDFTATPVKKQVVEVITEPVISKSIQLNTNKTPFRKLNLVRYSPIPNDTKEYIATIIKENYTDFGGNMTYQQIADNLGVSISTIQRIATKIKINKVIDRKNNEWKPGQTKFEMTIEEEKALLEDYRKHSVTWLFNKYKKYGFTDPKQIYGKIRGIKRRMKVK